MIRGQIDCAPGLHVDQQTFALNTSAMTQHRAIFLAVALDSFHAGNLTLRCIHIHPFKDLQALPDALNARACIARRERHRDIAMRIERAEPHPRLCAPRSHVDNVNRAVTLLNGGWRCAVMGDEIWHGVYSLSHHPLFFPEDIRGSMQASFLLLHSTQELSAPYLAIMPYASLVTRDR